MRCGFYAALWLLGSGMLVVTAALHAERGNVAVATLAASAAALYLTVAWLLSQD